MPVSLIAAGVGAAVSSAVGAGIVGAIAGALAATTVGTLFRSKPKSGADMGGLRETVRHPIAPWQWIYGETRVGGTVTFLEVTTIDGRVNHAYNLVITLAGHEIEEVSQVYFNDEAVQLDGTAANGGGSIVGGRYNAAATVQISLGDEPDGVQPFAQLVSHSNGKWTNEHRQTGRAKLYVLLIWNPDIYANGIPRITAKVKGRKVFDPRTGLTAWSDNWALCVADWLANNAAGLGCDYSTEIDEDQLIAAANICDETVTLAAGGTEPRYTMNGALFVDGAPRETLARLNTAANGVCRFLGGVWKIYPAAYATPDPDALTADDLRGDLHVIPRVSRRDLCNGVKGLYSSPGNFWQPTDFPPVANDMYLAEDQGERIWRELDLPFTNSASMGQRIAKIELEKVRQQIVVEWPGKLGCYRLQPGDTVPVTLDFMGWSGKIFEVVSTQLVFEEAGGEDGGVVVGCDLVLRETAAAVYDWDSGEETEVDLAPDTDMPNPFEVVAPGIPSITEVLYETRDGRGVATKAVVSWAVSADAFAVYYQPEFKLSAESEWTVLPIQASTTVEVLDLQPDDYDFRVKAINGIGVSSAYATKSAVEILGLGPAPAAPSGISIQAGGGTARLKLDEHPELDVKRGGRILVRFCHEGVTPSWESAFSVGEPLGWPGDSTQIDVPLKPGTYLLKARDSTGHESEAWAEISTKQASVLEFTGVATIQEDDAYPGTHSGTAPVDGILTLGGVGMFDDIPDLDAVTDLDGYGGVGSSGTYTFTSSTDLGSVRRVRVTSRLEGSINNLLDLIDDRTGNVDDWVDFDGATFGGSSADAWVEARETDDDPAGAPVWSEWKRLDAAEFEARGFQFRAQLTTADAAYRPQISVLRVVIEEVV